MNMQQLWYRMQLTADKPLQIRKNKVTAVIRTGICQVSIRKYEFGGSVFFMQIRIKSSTLSPESVFERISSFFLVQFRLLSICTYPTGRSGSRITLIQTNKKKQQKDPIFELQNRKLQVKRREEGEYPGLWAFKNP
jgi:hypothetical protein